MVYIHESIYNVYIHYVNPDRSGVLLTPLIHWFRSIEMNTKVDDIVARCAALRTLMTARVITRHYDDSLRDVGLTITQFTLLTSIAKIEPDSISELADALYSERTSVTRNLKLLEDVGLLTRTGHTSGRKSGIRLTEAGHAKLRDAYPLWKTAQDKVEALFSEQEYEGAKEALRTLRSVEKTGDQATPSKRLARL